MTRYKQGRPGQARIGGICTVLMLFALAVLVLLTACS